MKKLTSFIAIVGLFSAITITINSMETRHLVQQKPGLLIAPYERWEPGHTIGHKPELIMAQHEKDEVRIPEHGTGPWATPEYKEGEVRIPESDLWKEDESAKHQAAQWEKYSMGKTVPQTKEKE